MIFVLIIVLYVAAALTIGMLASAIADDAAEYEGGSVKWTKLVIYSALWPVYLLPPLAWISISSLTKALFGSRK